MLEIKIIKCLEDNYSYLLKDKKTNLVAVVDPSEFKTVDEEINKNYKKLDFILNTHHHFDHVGGNLQLKTKYNAKFCIKIDKDNLKLKKRVKDVTNKTNLDKPTIPITLEEEIETNTFLRYDVKKIKKTLELDNASKVEVFKKLRILKDQL